MTKADYVRAQGDASGDHHCHWPGCTRACPPAKWGCSKHWFTLPVALRRRIWQTFRPGQEVSKTPSADYINAARDAQAWIAQHIAAQAASRLL